MRASIMLVLAAFWGLSAEAEDPIPTRADFIREVFDSRPTSVTPKFHDAPKGYHIVKENLVKGLIEEAKKRKIDLRSIVIAGPMPLDPLWTYHIVVFIREKDRIRINSLVFPHARITYKSTGLVTTERYEKWVNDLVESGVLEPKLPEVAKAEKDETKRDMTFTLLVATIGPDGKEPHTSYANPQNLEDEKQEQFQDALNGILDQQKKMYSLYKDDEAE